MKHEILRTYKFYDEKGRRLSIFGRVETDLVDNKEYLTIFVLTCSNEDNFCKKTAREAYDKWLIDKTSVDINPQEFNILIKEGKPFYSFIKFCKENFLVKIEGFECITKDFFIKPNVASYE